MKIQPKHHSFPETFPWIFDIWTSALKYIIEVHNSDDDLVAILQNSHAIVYIKSINEAPLLNFNLPADDSKVDNITKANEIWLRNYREDIPSVVAKFRLKRRIDGRLNTLITTTEVDGLINQLADEQLITAYTPENQTVTTIVTALLALQVLSPEITVGTIAPTVSRTMTFNPGESILKCLLRLRDTVGGYISVDNDRAFQWNNSIGEDKGQQIRYRKNLTGITREIDYTTIGNRLYAYGAGEGDARIRLSDADGQAEDYVEDTDSQTAWGGIFVKTIVDKSITDADTLLAWAILQLAEVKDPRTAYRIDTVDLAESDLAGFDFEALQLGSTVTVIDEDLGVDVSSQVIKITYTDLLHPEFLQIEFANRTRNILDTFEQFGQTQETEELAEADPTVLLAVSFIVDGGGTVITTGQKGHISLPFNGEILSAKLLADQVGDIVVDIWKRIYASFPPTNAQSITASAPLTLSSANKTLDETLTGWTTAFTAGDVLAFTVDSIDIIERVTVVLVVKRT